MVKGAKFECLRSVPSSGQTSVVLFKKPRTNLTIVRSKTVEVRL